ncbi:MAG TPA: 23S rRNA (adenine(2503)-C(2))-methyltransferase RlmN [Clostridiales bacterium]|jgi:23S rRNA (adenine2503-C2)-methyltransferase|nr:23S rRNA (adenine(2503)-C(2))-methyltransferase RlmN [Clostridiales bacterium]
MSKSDIKSMLPTELEASLAEMGEPSYRAGQIFTWLMRGAPDFASMTNIGKSLQQKLDERFYITVPEILRKQVSKEDGTIKYLWKLRDGSAIESVLMRYKHGNTVCVSSQVGCRMNCAFCASAHGGLIRNLTASEILDQVLFSEKDSGSKISNIVLMGIGEPLDNFDNVMKFLELVNHPDGMNIGMRHISLSTCGLPDKIDKLADYNLQLTLSLSLHAPDDKTRLELMPVGRRYPIREVIDACRRYYEKTGRRISIEYAMIDRVNDSDEQAEMLADIAHSISAHINLIPLNNVEGSPLKPSRRINQFIKTLEGKGANVTVRRRLGGDIEAACGQLRKKVTG